MSESPVRWVQWWQWGHWLEAHPDWQPAALPALYAPQVIDWARSRHALLASHYGVTPCNPPPPRSGQAALLSSPAPWVPLAFQLVDRLCYPRRPSPLPADACRWCDRVTKALRPGQWLPDGGDSLLLLRAWLAPGAWQRARLRFPRARIVALEQLPGLPAPPARLDTLWQSTLWKASSLTPCPE